jgi:hypothetical protein
MAHAPTNAVTQQRYNSLQVGSSAYGGCVPLLYGRQRLPFNLTWYNNFQEHQQSSGGKGGGGGKGSGTYTYSASFTATICEGPINVVNGGIVTAWRDKDLTTLNGQGLTLFSGGTPLTFTAAPGSGATSATLTTGFPLPTGHWLVRFSDGEQRQCAFTLNGTSCNWSADPLGGLTSAVNAAAVCEGQNPWNYLTSNYPTQAIPYDHLCYVGSQNYGFGESAAMPNLTFEVDGFIGLPVNAALNFANGLNAGQQSAVLSAAWSLPNGNYTVNFSDGEQFFCAFLNGQTSCAFSQPLANAATSAFNIGGFPDADPAQIIVDYLTDQSHGLGLPSTYVANLLGLTNSYQAYCRSMGMFVSPYESTQRSAADFIKEILQITNSEAVWSAGQLKIIPYADQAVAGNGYSYTPNLTPLYSFTDDDFIHAADEDPVQLRRRPDSDTFNHYRVEYLDRSNQYAVGVAEASDNNNIVQTKTERVAGTLSFHQICVPTTARLAAQIALQVDLYERNYYTFKVRFDYCCLEPMDYVSITDANLGLNQQLVRVTKVTFDEKDEITIEAMEMPGTARTPPIYNWQPIQGYAANWATAPGDVAPPIFIEPPPGLVDAAGGRNLWIGVAPSTSNDGQWGGCYCNISFDGITYTQYGSQIPFRARYGTLTANLAAVADPDTTSTLEVQLQDTNQVLESGTQADADADRMLIAVGTGSNIEIISFETATLTGAGAYNLTYLRRGQYGTPVLSHSIGAQFVRLDGNLIQYPLDPGQLGETIYFKFTSYNVYGREQESISSATAYTYTPDLSQIAYNAVSEATFSADGSAVVGSPSTAFKQSTAASAWDSAIYTSQSFTNGSSARLTPSQTNAWLAFGLTTTPP